MNTVQSRSVDQSMFLTDIDSSDLGAVSEHT